MVTEAELELATRQKDAEAFSRLFEMYRPRLLGFVERQISPSLRQKFDPEDVLQELMLSCVQAFP